MRVADNRVPTAGIGKMPLLAALGAVAAVVMTSNNISPVGCCRRKPGISIPVFAQAVHYLDDVCRRAGRVPHLQLNFVAVLCVQY